MKKILALLTVVMVVVFVGCGKEKEVKMKCTQNLRQIRWRVYFLWLN